MTGLTVLHVNTERGFRGGEIQNLYLAAGLQARGHRCLLAVQAGSPLAERAAARGLEVHGRPMRGEFDVGAVAWLRRLMRAEPPDVVHCHTSHGVTLATLARLRRGGPARVFTRRTLFPTRRNPLFRLKFTYRLDHIIAVSKAVRDDLVAAGISAGRITVVHSGIDLQRFEGLPDRQAWRRQLGLPDGAVLLGSVGALDSQKGHGHLIRVLAALAQSFPQTHLVLVGRGPEQQALMDEARRLEVADRFHLAGFRDDVPSATAAFDVAVMPSLLGEGSPAVIKEAMAAGVPVVASRTGGVAEILQDGIQGLLVAPGDSAALESALGRLIRDPALRQAMGEAGRLRAREFSMERMVSQTEAVYLALRGAGV